MESSTVNRARDRCECDRGRTGQVERRALARAPSEHTMTKWTTGAAFWLILLSAFVAEARPRTETTGSGGPHGSASSGLGDGGGFIAFVILLFVASVVIQQMTVQNSWNSDSGA